MTNASVSSLSYIVESGMAFTRHSTAESYRSKIYETTENSNVIFMSTHSIIPMGEITTNLPFLTSTSNDSYNETFNIGNATDSQQAERNNLLHTSQMVYFYSSILFILFGLVGNSLSIAVFMVTKMRKTTTGHFLVTLAFSDILVLLSEFIIWISAEDLGFRVIHYNDFVCKTTYYIRYSARMVSAVITCLITLERYIMVAYPLKAMGWFKTSKVKITIIISYITCFALGSYSLILLKIDIFDDAGAKIAPMKYCSIVDADYNAYLYCQLILLTGISQVGSGFFVAVLTFMITKKLVAASNRRHHMQMSKDFSRAQEHQLTMTLVAVAIAFVVLRAPYTIAWCLRQFLHFMFKMVKGDTITDLYAAVNISYIFDIMNYSINFLLYFFCGSQFRNNLKALLCCDRMALKAARSRRHTISRLSSASIKVASGLSKSSSKESITSSQVKATAIEMFSKHIKKTSKTTKRVSISSQTVVIDSTPDASGTSNGIHIVDGDFNADTPIRKNSVLKWKARTDKTKMSVKSHQSNGISHGESIKTISESLCYDNEAIECLCHNGIELNIINCTKL